jgi:hypothetical protein
MHSTPDGSKQVGLHKFDEVEIVPRHYITPMVARKLGCIHLYVLQIRIGNYVNTPRATKKIGCIHFYVLQIRPKNCISTP